MICSPFAGGKRNDRTEEVPERKRRQDVVASEKRLNRCGDLGGGWRKQRWQYCPAAAAVQSEKGTDGRHSGVPGRNWRQWRKEGRETAVTVGKPDGAVTRRWPEMKWTVVVLCFLVSVCPI
ncbi:hypothetical protein POM88_053977 [Heracleum sosnowskyi]|uniref:Uncharacterized protein n=1 Tax=Heracleum sosnowskyi TaxID=360622 RepID=A0AAD8GN37_9APIA|nr:hypothetical protein POM88_053973 [Heracleum sosnowskyi]KAK1351836.1 hypothetical protein POM88_053977 [Heracleum sosnowskyi]